MHFVLERSWAREWRLMSTGMAPNAWATGQLLSPRSSPEDNANISDALARRMSGQNNSYWGQVSQKAIPLGERNSDYKRSLLSIHVMEGEIKPSYYGSKNPFTLKTAVPIVRMVGSNQSICTVCMYNMFIQAFGESGGW